MKTCAKCPNTLHGSNRSGICLPCQSSRTCADCSAPISVRSTGRCRACANVLVNADEANRLAKSEAMKRRYMDPEFKAVRDECSRIAAAKRVAKPGERERLAQWGRTVGVKNFLAGQTPEARAKAAQSSSATKLAHISPAYRTLYRSIRAQNISAPEAERMVLEQQQADRRNAPSLVAANENAMREKHRREVESRY